jgi:Cys-rich repeat protein
MIALVWILAIAPGCTVGRSVLGGPREDAGIDGRSPGDGATTDGASTCASDDQCPADRYCDRATGRCEPGCSRDEACTGETPRCNPSTRTCVPCVTDAHCPAGNVCRGNRCVRGCSPTQPCPLGQRCCTDACVDTESNPANCGGCGMSCTLPNAEPTCTMGRCAVGRCAGRFGDCDRDAMNGCETDTRTSAAHCGRCGLACPVPANARATCAEGACGFACEPGFGDCNRDPADGCEADLRTSTAHCGTCGTACATANGTAACRMGACAVGMCSPGFENCDNAQANGCEADLRSDPRNCGGCSRICGILPNSTPGCATGACGIASCDAGFADCDRNVANGCEVDTRSSAEHCGACGRACAFANASGACASGACRLVRCNPGFADCDGNPLNGCEVNLATDIDHCGACRNVCPTPMGGGAACRAGMCTVGACARPLADCNGSPTDGCEVNTDTSIDHCGACGAACARPANGTAGCRAGACEIASCNTGFSDCDRNLANGCETNLASDPRSCGRCGAACPAPANGTAGCAFGVCSVGACDPGFANCDGLAANGCEAALATSGTHCGACGRACTGGQSCAGGVCQCPTGQTLCAGLCTSTGTDVRNCGACGRACSVGQVCNGGVCQCPPGQSLCGGACVNAQTDVRNCGACGRVCSVDQTCVMGACIGAGQLRFTATWSIAGDVDLHIVPPCGTEISYATRTACGGTLDRDDTTGTGPENVFWSSGAAAGPYLVCAVPYAISGPTTVTVSVVRGASTVQTLTRTFSASTGNQACTSAASSYLGTFTF